MSYALLISVACGFAYLFGKGDKQTEHHPQRTLDESTNRAIRRHERRHP